MITKLFLEEIENEYIRENFKKIYEYVRDENFLKGEFKFFEISVDSAVTNLRYTHNLKFSPTDIIQTSIIGAGAITWNYALFNNNFLDITTTDACTVRAFIGRYGEYDI